MKYVNLGIKIPEELRDEIDSFAAKVWKSRSEWVREACVEKMVRYEENN